MKKKILIIITLLLALMMTACGASSAEEPAESTPAPTVEIPNSADVIQNITHMKGTDPTESEHRYTLGCDENGMLFSICMDCGDNEIVTERWEPLTQQRFIGDSNLETSSEEKDVMIGDWEIIPGTDVVCWNAMKFWVVDRDGYNNTEWIEYGVDEKFNYLSGMIALSTKSDSGAAIQVNIYIDGNLAFASQELTDSQEQPFVLDISDATTVRVECIGCSYAFGHGVVNCAVF